MRRTAILATLAGLALLIGLILREGIAEVLTVLSIAGWSLLWVALFHSVPFSLDTLGWLSLTRNHRPPVYVFFWARWVAESFNSLLPVAQVGGHVMRAILIAGRRLPIIQASATVMVDFTMGLVTQFLFSLLGILLLLRYLGTSNRIIGFAGLGLGLLFLIGFYFAQKKGIFSFAVQFIRKNISSSKRLTELGGSALALDEQITRIYRQHGDLLICGMLRLAGWLMKAAEIMLALHLLGYPVSYQDALIIESLSNVVVYIFFFIPGGIGVLEGSILLLGSLLGLPSDVALALALIRRGRELVVGIPGLSSWLITEGSDIVKKNKDLFNFHGHIRK
jgi:putative membrane protein